jgi:RNA polymerase sigma-54 factor
MAIELKQQLRLSQQLVMTPQLQQAIKLLQLNRLELVGLVQQELEENPVLEEAAEESDDDTGEPSESVESNEELDTEAGSEAASAAEEISADAAQAETTVEEPTDAEKFDDLDWQNYLDSNPQTAQVVAPDDDRPSIDATLSRGKTLSEHLQEQLQLSSFPADEEAAAHFLIGNIDERGYLQATISEISRQSGIDEASIESALTRLQEFDPSGVCARDLRECIQIQVKAQGITDPVVLRIIETCFDTLIRRDFRGVARKLGIPIEDVSAAALIIGRLEPRPGRPFGSDEPVYIIPDIYVYKVADDFHIVLNDDGLPRLKISGLYRDVLTKSKGDGMSRETKNYVQEKVRSALWLIKSIHQRQRTIYRVMESIIKHQREFFERGVDFLKPLNLRDIADDIEMHESTVSRVTTAKYVHTPQGIFELKYFFNSSIKQVVGDAVASEAVKERIRKLITAEDPRRPLSDQRLAEMLKSANIDIARRTVTKYREQLNILSSTKRRDVS